MMNKTLLVGFIIYLVGLVLAGGPRRVAINYLGTIIACVGLFIAVVELREIA